jgi:hypothetical protein
LRTSIQDSGFRGRDVTLSAAGAALSADGVALSPLGERVVRTGVFFSRDGSGEGVRV